MLQVVEEMAETWMKMGVLLRFLESHVSWTFSDEFSRYICIRCESVFAWMRIPGNPMILCVRMCLNERICLDAYSRQSYDSVCENVSG